MTQLALELSQGGGRFEEIWHPILEFPLMLKCFRALQPDLLIPLEKNEITLHEISDYLLHELPAGLPPQLAHKLTEDLAETLYGMKILMKKKDLRALQYTLAEKKAKARERLERLLKEYGEEEE